MTYSKKIEDILQGHVGSDLFMEIADSVDMTSTAGENNDGSTGPEMLDNGISLCRKALAYSPDVQIFLAEADGSVHYVFGLDEDDAVRRLREIIADLKGH